MLKKLIEKIFGRRCACTTQSMCQHLNTTTKKVNNNTFRTRGRITDSAGNTVASAGTAIANNKSKVTNVTRPGENMYSSAGESNPRRVNRKSGGRAGLKSGGKVKGCGIAKRGLGRAMKKGKR